MSTTQTGGRTMPPQHQERRPGLESEMSPRPRRWTGSTRAAASCSARSP
ncbi:hypothetical protein LJK88_50085 [Paenibacillus sp. P26]|nr:hypothetical protein LJK88_50085 [Paenibacillus sp. P26]